MLLALFFVIVLFHQNYSLNLDQNYQVASWDDSRKLCDLAGENDVCSSTSGLCNIKLSVENVSHIFSNPLWINGFVTRPPWIYHIGCTIVRDDLLPSHRTGVFKLNTDQNINDCVSACGNSSSYGLSDSLCHCLLDLPRTKSNLSNCQSSCQIGSTKPCKESTGNNGIIYMTEYKQYRGNLIKQVSNSPWYSCTAANTSSNVIQTEDCRKNLPFICMDQSGFDIHNTLVTWYAANEHCKNESKLLINGTSFSSDKTSNGYFWTGIHRPLKWTWDINEDVPNYDVIDCLVLNKDEKGLELQTRNCSFDGLSGLCVNIQTGNTTFNFSQTNKQTNNRGDRDNTNVESNTSSVYIGIGIGAVVLCIALIVGAVLARRRFIKNKNSRLLPVKNGAKNQTDIETDDSIHLRNEGFEVNRELEAGEYKDNVQEENTETLNDKNRGQSSSNQSSKDVEVVIETIPDKHKNRKSAKSTSKKKKTREIEISIEDESVTIVDDGSYETQLSQTV